LKFTILIAALLFSIACQEQKSAEPAPAQEPVPTTSAAPPATAGVQTVDLKISGGEYQPASLNVRAGVPVRLNVTRDEKPTCGDVLSIPSQNISKPIPVNQVTTVEFTPKTAGDLEFTCGMNMMKGKIVVQ
jgi:plastocyanin domain-containing protein